MTEWNCQAMLAKRRLATIKRIEEEYCCRLGVVALGFAAVGYTLSTTAGTIGTSGPTLRYLLRERGVDVDWPTQDEEDTIFDGRYYTNGTCPKRSEKSVAQLARLLAYEKARDGEHD